MNSALQERADAANDSYQNRSQSEIDKPKAISLGGKWYQVFGYANDPVTGFHATAYREVASPHNIIIAYRGTDPGLFSGETKALKADHAPTTLQDIAVDATMVRDTVNPQKAAADRFTAEMIDKAAKQGIPKDHIFVAGHSLGGTLAEIEAAKYGLAGTTFNAYGAVGLTDGPPQPGCYLTNYRMASDVVSAANPHIGTVVPLASQEDVQSLRDGRYLDAPVGAPPPNALIAMRLGDHGVGHFHNGPDNVLSPHRFQEAAQRYADNKAAFDRFSGDVSRERGELSLALRQMQAPDSHVRLPPDIQRQADEYLALHADPSVRHAIEQNGPVRSAEQGLHFVADVARAGGQFVQTQDEHVAKAAREAGMVAIPLSPAAPLVGLAVGEVAHLHGQAADAAGRFVGDRLQSAKGIVEQDAQMVADAAVRTIHDPGFQAGTVGAVNHVVDTYHRVQATGQTIETLRQVVVDSAEQDLQYGADAARAAGQFVHAQDERMAKAAREAGMAVAPLSPVAPLVGLAAGEAAHLHGQAVDAAGRFVGDRLQSTRGTLEQGTHIAADAVVGKAHDPGFQATAPGYARADPRHPDNPDHALYNELHNRIPEACENRLLQLTAACHAKGITDQNLKTVYLNGQDNTVVLASGGLRPEVTAVDVTQPSPPPVHSIQQIQNHDAAQTLLNQQIQQQLQQINMQAQQGPVMGGR
jgi:hypothetical protein